MSKILVTGYLTDPLDRPASDVRIRVTATDNTGQTLEHSTAEVVTDTTGYYSFDLVYGHYAVEIFMTDTYEVAGAFFVNDGTPTEIDVLTLINYSEELVPEILIPGTSDWENLYDDIREGIDSTELELPNQLSDGDTTVAETKEVFSNERLGSHLGQDTQDLKSGDARVTNQPTVYSDEAGRQSATTGSKLSTDNATNQQTQELYKDSDGLVEVNLTREADTPDGLIVDNISLVERDGTAQSLKTLSVGDASTSDELSLAPEQVIKHSERTLETGDVKLNHELLDVMQDGYINDDSIEVDGAFIESSKTTSLDTGTHTASIYDGQKALVDVDDVLQIVQEKGITAYDKVLYERQSVVDGSLTIIEKNPDVYDITDAEGTSVFTVNTVTKEVELNAKLIIGNSGDFKGDSGDTIFEVYQYSADNITWFDTWTTGYTWRRHATSTNGVVGSWSDGYTMVGEDGADGDTYYNEYQYATSSKNGPWHDEYIDEDMYRRWRTVSLGSTPTDWSIEVIRGNNGTDGEIVTITYQYSTDGFDPWHTDFLTGDHYRRERTEYFKAVGDDPYLVSAWSSPVQIVPVSGQDYFNGLSQTVIYLYQRSLGASPTLPTTDLTYDFSTTVLSGELGGWSTGVPSGTDTIWVTAATASSSTGTDDIAASEWVTPEILGGSAYNQANITVYQRSDDLPTAPTGTVTYDFTTGVLTGELGDWVHGSLPSGVNDLYAATASAVSQNTTADIASDDWGVGILSSNVYHQQTVQIYLRSTDTPDAPASDVTYNFTDGTITGLTGGWTRLLPEGTDDMYVGIAVASGSGNTDNIATTDWSVGLMGASGHQVVALNLYNDSIDTPELPTVDTTYDFVNNELTVLPDNGWTTTFPLNTTGKIWVTTATASGSALVESDVIPSSEWTEAALFMEAGLQVATVTLYRADNDVLGEDDLPSLDMTYSFSEAKLISTPDNAWSITPVSSTSVIPVWITTASVSTKTTNDEDIIESGEWTEPVVLVTSGSTIYDVYEYSVSGEGDWHVEFTTGDIYRRTAVSTNGVLGDWSIAKLAGNDGEAGDTIWIAYLYSSDLLDWHSVLEPEDIYRKEAIVTNDVYGDYSEPARIVGNSDIIEYEYSADGSTVWHTNFSTGDYYRRERSVLNDVAGEWSEAVQIVPIKGADYTDGTAGTDIYEIYNYSVDGLTDWHDDFRDDDIYRRTAVVVFGDISDWSEAAKLSGIDGAPGDTIYYEYQYSIDGITDWHDLLVDGDRYRQERLVTNGSASSWSEAAIIAGTDGADGDTIYIEYNYSTDGEANWHTNFSDGDHYRRERVVKNDVYGDWSEATKLVPIYGEDYSDGVNGEDGTTYYTWVKYADSDAGEGMSNDPTGKSYIGIANNQLTETESSDPTDYTWALTKGEKGIKGETGEDGITYYTWVRYADDEEGTGMAQDPTDKLYIGLAYNKVDAIEGDDPTDYQWSRYVGYDGNTVFDVYEYSIDGETSWHTDFVTGDNYRRNATSFNGAVGEWSTPAKLTGKDGAVGDTIYVAYAYSADLTEWHTVLDEGDIYRKEAIVTNGVYAEWSEPVRIVGNSDLIEYEYSVNGVDLWHSNFSQGDYYRRERSVYNDVAGDWSEAVQIVPIKEVDYSDGETPVSVYEVYEYSIDGSTDWHTDYEDADIYRRTAVVIAGEVSEWSEASKITGLDGVQSAPVMMFQLGSTAPELPNGEVTYTFADGSVSGSTNGWSTSVPSNTEEGGSVWRTQNTALGLASDLTDVMDEDDWSTPEVFVQNGGNGTDGSDGKHGNGSYIYLIASADDIPDDAGKDDDIESLADRPAQDGDILTYQGNATVAEDDQFSYQFLRTDGSWVEFAFVVNGSAIINGTLAAEKITAGDITGTQISADSIINVGDTANEYAHMAGSDSAYAFVAGKESKTEGEADAPFSVTHKGKLKATDADIAGNINTKTGVITNELTIGASTDDSYVKMFGEDADTLYWLMVMEDGDKRVRWDPDGQLRMYNADGGLALDFDPSKSSYYFSGEVHAEGGVYGGTQVVAEGEMLIADLYDGDSGGLWQGREAEDTTVTQAHKVHPGTEGKVDSAMINTGYVAEDFYFNTRMFVVTATRGGTWLYDSGRASVATGGFTTTVVPMQAAVGGVYNDATIYIDVKMFTHYIAPYDSSSTIQWKLMELLLNE